jgi:hypothetical protein
LFSDDAQPSSCVEDKSSKVRIRFDARLQKIFADLLENHNNGDTKRLLEDLSPGRVLERGQAWDSFTQQFNSVSTVIVL